MKSLEKTKNNHRLGLKNTRPKDAKSFPFFPLCFWVILPGQKENGVLSETKNEVK
jgi:hypothetical protein